MAIGLTHEDMTRWAHQPETQKFLADLQTSKQETMEIWARCGFASTSEANAKALGGVDVLAQIIEVIEGLTAKGEAE